MFPFIDYKFSNEFSHKLKTLKYFLKVSYLFFKSPELKEISQIKEKL